MALCAKKIDSLLASSFLGNGYMKCPIGPEKVRIDSALLIPLNHFLGAQCSGFLRFSGRKVGL